MKDQLIRYAEYNYWANLAMIQFALSLPPDMPDREVKSSFPSLRKTFFHIWDAEVLWLNRMKGVSPTAWPSQKAEKHDLQDRFPEDSRMFFEFIRGKDDVFFNMDCSYRNIKGDPFTRKNWHIVMHCMNHSSFHRGQAVTIVRMLGVDSGIPSTDFIYALPA